MKPRTSDSPHGDTYGIACLDHNIPRQAQTGSSLMCAVRIQNKQARDLYFQSHASFYGTPIKDTRHHLSIHVNGEFARPVLVPDDCLHEIGRAHV